MADEESVTQALRKRIEEQIASSGETLQNQVVTTLVDQELIRRCALVVAGIVKIRQLELDLRKVNKPDNEAFDAEGKVVHQTYSKGKLEEIKKAKEKIETWDRAINNAIGKADYKRLEELVSKGGKENKEE